MDSKQNGFYKVCLEQDGFKTPFVVYARSNEEAVVKALNSAAEELPGARIHEVDGPYANYMAL